MSVYDPKSNGVFTLVDASAQLTSGSNRNATSVDLRLGRGVTWLIDITATAGTLTVKNQYSSDNSSFTDEPNTTAGNETSTAFTTTGLKTLHMPNPRARYGRVNGAASGGNVTYSVIAVQFPKRQTIV